jgi:hypothetical protein
VAAVALERTRALSRGDPVEQRVGHRNRRDERFCLPIPVESASKTMSPTCPSADIGEFVTAMSFALFSFAHIAT